MGRALAKHLVGLLVCLMPATPTWAQQPESRPSLPVLLDSDIGDDIDDAFALALVLASPQLDLRGVTTVYGDAHTRALIVRRFLHAVGRDDIPIAAGAPAREKPDSAGQFQYGLRPVHGQNKERGLAVDLLYQQLKARPGELTLIAVGPLTNIAALLREHADCRPWIKRLVVMGGAIRKGYNDKSKVDAEWNIRCDIKAAQAVFASGVPLWLAPLDATAHLKLDKASCKRIFQAGGALGRELEALYQLWGKEIPILFDPVAVALCFEEKLCKLEPMHVVVDDEGFTRAGSGKPNAQVAVETDRAEFLSWFIKQMTERRDLKPAPPGRPRPSAKAGKLTHLIPINTATPSELQKLPGIGPALAQRIIERRQQAPFTSVDELRRVPGIGPKITERLLPLVTIENLPRNVVSPVGQGGMPRLVHVFEDFETDIEKRWWLCGTLETKNLPPGAKRACRGALTNDFDDRQGDPDARYTAVIFNPVPGPPLAKNPRLSFRYWLKGTDTLRVQLYSLTRGYHRHLLLTGLPQESWRAATVDLTTARRPDGSGGPFAAGERIDDIQFYADPATELLIDDIVLYDAAAPDETKPFPQRVLFTGWFDTGRQGKEWPGDFEIVKEPALTSRVAQSVRHPELEVPWIRLHLRGERTLGDLTHLRVRYRLSGPNAMQVRLMSAAGESYGIAMKDLSRNAWTEATFDFSRDSRRSDGSDAKPRAGERIEAIEFLLPSAGQLQVSDLLLYVPS